MVTLNDIITITDVQSFKVDVSLDEEQFGWFVHAYGTISSYKGNRIKVKEIDDALSLLGEQEIFNSGLDSYFGGQLLSLKSIGLSESERKELMEYEEKEEREPHVAHWKPVVGNKKIYLIGKDNQLFFGIAQLTEIDGQGTFISIPLAKIEYRLK